MATSSNLAYKRGETFTVQFNSPKKKKAQMPRLREGLTRTTTTESLAKKQQLAEERRKVWQLSQNYKYH